MKNSKTLPIVLVTISFMAVACSFPGSKKSEVVTPSAQNTPVSSAPQKSETLNLNAAQFDLVQKGMTRDQVSEIFGNDGEKIQTDGKTKYDIASYKWSDSSSRYILVTFLNGKVISKSKSKTFN